MMPEPEVLQPQPERVGRCRVCGNRSLIPIGGLGSQYLSSMFPARLDYRDEVPRLPLDLVLCERTEAGTTCGLVQLAHRLDLRIMYDLYPYSSSTNSSMPAILEDVADSGRSFGHLQKGDVVLDIGGNDGTLLSSFRDQGFHLVAIDPARNIQPILTSGDYTHVRQFFSAQAYATATSKKARLVFSIAMFYHLADPVGFSRDVAECLADDGVWVIQMAYLPSMLRTNMYDNIVHEHCGYYAAHQMAWIMGRVGLEVFDMALNDVYGGSFRVFVKKRGCGKYGATARYRATLGRELVTGIFDPDSYRDFMGRVAAAREDLRSLCRGARHEGKSIWVYGASTKGNTILQYCGLGKEDLVGAADANPFKMGKYMVGSDIPILDEATMRAARPDYLLALPYSFVDAFVKREAALVARGTRFIVPLPEVRVVR
jgi:NDP-4-keto-2,6-dideoxyhexose 3-C-methyltransferase